jgi:hypothetical protein
MANTFTKLSYANTFDNWVVLTNDLATELNSIGKYNWTKDSGILFLDGNPTSLVANNLATFTGPVQVTGSGSSLYVQNNLTVDKQVYFTNTTLGLTNSGQANINGLLIAQGPNTGLLVANTANVNGNLFVVGIGTFSNDVFILNNNDITVSGNSFVANTSYTNVLQANTRMNTATLSVTGPTYTATLQANNSTNTTIAYTNTLQANTVVNTVNLVVSVNAIVNNVQCNTTVNTTTLSVVGASYTSTLQANNSTNTTIAYTNTLQANSIVNTVTMVASGAALVATLQANTSTNTNIAYAATFQGNTNVNTATLSVTGTSFTNALQANSSVNTRTLTVTGATLTNTLQANTSVNTYIAYATTLQGNTNVNTATLSVTGNALVDTLRANSLVNSVIIQAKTGLYTSYLRANGKMDVYDTLTAYNDFIVQGNFIVSGPQQFNANSMILNAVNPKVDASYQVNRAPDANAEIKWVEVLSSWRIRDIYNTDPATAYSNVLTANAISDSVLSTSSATVASSRAANTLNTAIRTANTNLKNYTDSTFYTKTGGTISGDVTITGNTNVQTVTGTTVNVTTINVNSLNVAGGSANQILYRTTGGITEYLPVPSNGNYLKYNSSTGFVWDSVTVGTVTSVSASSNVSGLSISTGASPITTSGTITLSGTLATANGGTGNTSFTGGAILVGGGTGPVSVLANTSASGAYGNNSFFPVIVVDTYGRVSSATNTRILIDTTQIVQNTGSLAVNTSTANTIVLNRGASAIGYFAANSNTTSAVAQVSVDSFVTSTYRSAKYLVQMSSGTSYHMVELSIIHDGTNVYLSQYGEVNTGGSLGSFDASISGGILTLLFTPTNASTTIKLTRTLIAV